MATLSLSREKALIGFAAKLKCYINGQVVCELAQNQVYQCPSASKQFIFNCNFPGNPIQLDMRRISLSLRLQNQLELILV